MTTEIRRVVPVMMRPDERAEIDELANLWHMSRSAAIRQAVELCRKKFLPALDKKSAAH